jgi:hypothetical protein
MLESEEEASRCPHIGFDSLFQKTPIIAQEKKTVSPGDVFEDATFKPDFHIVKF